MINTNISMPNPVLGIGGDFKIGGFEILIRLKTNRDTRTYEFYLDDVKVTNDYICALYQKNRVDLILKASCVPTYKTWTFVNELQFELSESEVDTVIELEAFLVTNCNIDDYFSETFSEDFDAQTFQLQEGDIVALTGALRIPIPKDNEKVSVGSIFRFSKIEASVDEKEVRFDFDSDQIVVYYPSEKEIDPVTYLFDKLQGLPFTALNIYILPALREAFGILQDSADQTFSDKKWYIILDQLLPPLSRSEDNYINAQKVINCGIPSIMAFDELLEVKKN